MMIQSAEYGRKIQRSVLLLGTMVTALSLAACRDTPLSVIPEGQQTLTGVLLPVPISLSRRGTHALMEDKKEVALVESTTVNLRDVEGVEVVVTGHFERNTDPKALPVLVASGVTLVNLQMRSWQLPVQHISLDAPVGWNPTFMPDGARFSETGGTVFLAVSTTALTTLPDADQISAGGRPAALVHGSGAQTLYIQNGSMVIALEFADDIAGSDALIKRIIRGITFLSSSSAPTVPSGSGGVATGVPCGGAAGILCPSGQYCEITDTVSNIGRCRTVKQ